METQQPSPAPSISRRHLISTQGVFQYRSTEGDKSRHDCSPEPQPGACHSPQRNGATCSHYIVKMKDFNFIAILPSDCIGYRREYDPPLRPAVRNISPLVLKGEYTREKCRRKSAPISDTCSSPPSRPSHSEEPRRSHDTSLQRLKGEG